MIKKRKFIIYVAICACVALFCCLLPFVLNKGTKASASYAVETAETVRESYMLGEQFTIPDGELVEGGNRYQAEQSMLVFPDGKINENKEQVLSQMGDYTLLYTAKVDGKTAVAQKSFTVVDSYYTFSGESADNGAYEWTDSFNMAPESDLSGLRVKIPMGATFNINEPFDVSALTKDNPVVTLYPYNNTFLMGKNGKTIQGDIQIVLTDYYDPTNYVVLTFYWVKSIYVGPSNYTCYVNYWAGVQDSEMYCMTPSGAESAFEYNGKTYVPAKTYYGINAYHWRSDVWKDADGKIIAPNLLNATLAEDATYSHSVGFSFYYDNETMELYASDTNEKKFVTNFGLSEVYGDKAFKGFTGDKFYVSIRGANYRVASGMSTNDAAVEFEVSDILGRSGSELFAENMPNDTIAPHIQVAGEGQTLTVAKDEKIKIPTPVVKDIDLKQVVSEVYFAYGTSQQTLVAIENGTFTPKRVGDYTVVYTAEDNFGNISTAKLDMQCKIFPENRSLRLQVDEVDSPEAGTVLTLPSYRLEGNVGKTAKVFYAYGDEAFTEIEDGGSFFVEHVGKYTIRYEYSDLLVSYVYEYEFTSVASDNVAFRVATLPNYFVKGSTYTLERLSGFVYTQADPKACDVTTYVSEDGDEFREIDANAYTVQASDTVRFKYVLNGVEEYSQTVPVRNVRINEVNDISMARYFVTTDFECEERLDRLVFTPKKAGTNTMEFVNPISVSNFFLGLYTPTGYSNYDSVQITLTDYYDHDRSIVITYSRNWVFTGDGYYGYRISCGDTSYTNNNVRFEANLLQINYASGKMYAGNGVFGIDGMLSSDKALLTITLKGVTLGESKLELNKLNNVVLSSYRFDDTRPQIAYKKECAIYEKFGKEITIYPADVTDVLSAFVIGNLQMYVEGPGGSSVTATDGTVLNSGIDPTRSYTFRLEKMGSYTVYYKYTDTNGNPVTSYYKIYILDDEAPTLTLNDGYNETTLVTAKVGDTYKVQTYTVEDDTTTLENLIVDVIAEAPDGCVSYVKKGEIVFTSKGIWRIYYYCLDEMGNVSTTYYTVRVE